MKLVCDLHIFLADLEFKLTLGHTLRKKTPVFHITKSDKFAPIFDENMHLSINRRKHI